MPWRLLRFALSQKHPEPRMFATHDSLKSSYDVVIIGAGGHGLALEPVGKGQEVAGPHGVGVDDADAQVREVQVDTFGDVPAAQGELVGLVTGDVQVVSHVSGPSGGVRR